MERSTPSPAEEPIIGEIVTEPGKPSFAPEELEASLKGGQPTIADPAGFARAVSQRYNDSLWGLSPAPVSVDLRRQEKMLAEKRRLYAQQRDTAFRDFTFALLMTLIQAVIALIVTANHHHPAALAFCWTVALTWGCWSIYWGLGWRKAKRKSEGLK